MKYFPEIIRILDRFREKRIETIDHSFRDRKENKEFQLYDGIRNGLFHNDSEAADTLYELPPTAAKYSTLKNRLKVRLLNSLFHLNLKRAGFSDSAQAFYLARKNAFMIHILFALGARKAAKLMAEKNLILAQQFSLTEVALSMARELRASAGNTGSMSEYDRYDILLKQLLREYEAELISLEYYERILAVLNRQSSGRPKIAAEFKSYALKLTEMLNNGSSYTFRLNYYRVQAMAAEASGNHNARITGAREAIKYLESVPQLLQNERLGDFWRSQLESYTNVRKYDDAFEAARQCAALYNPGSNSWFAYAEPYFVLLLNTLRFEEASKFFSEVTANSRFAAQPETAHEHWEIYRFYLNYALKSIPELAEHESVRRFNYDSFLRTVPKARRDKHGLNVAILIAQILHMIDIRDYNGVMDRMEALGTYRTRYLQASMTQASSLFFRLLHIMENNAFSYKISLAKGRHIHNQLRSEVFEIVDSEQEAQILPYEWLWDCILERLKEQAETKKIA